MAITEGRRLNVRADSPHRRVAERRVQFDDHIDACPDCQPALCRLAQSMWRNLCLLALRSSQDGV